MTIGYTESGLIGTLCSVVYVRPEAVVEGVVVAAAGTITALIIRAIWGFVERLINSRKNAKGE